MKQIESERLSTEDIIAYYNPELEKIAAFLPWLLKNAQAPVSQNYDGNGIKGVSIAFPVYDSTLLSFVKVCQSTNLMDRNYVYFYSRHHIRTVEDEHKFIDRATMKEMGDLWQILSKYIISGRTKGAAWAEGVTNGVYAHLIQKMQEMIIFWSREAVNK